MRCLSLNEIPLDENTITRSLFIHLLCKKSGKSTKSMNFIEPGGMKQIKGLFTPSEPIQPIPPIIVFVKKIRSATRQCYADGITRCGHWGSFPRTMIIAALVPLKNEFNEDQRCHSQKTVFEPIYQKQSCNLARFRTRVLNPWCTGTFVNIISSSDTCFTVTWAIM